VFVLRDQARRRGVVVRDHGGDPDVTAYPVGDVDHGLPEVGVGDLQVVAGVERDQVEVLPADLFLDPLFGVLRFAVGLVEPALGQTAEHPRTPDRCERHESHRRDQDQPAEPADGPSPPREHVLVLSAFVP